MALDEHRNAFYEQALKNVLTPDSIVLDAGAGIGVLGLMAARLGAAKVYLVEPATGLEAARQLARANGVEDRVEFIESTVEQAHLPEPVDVITSVFTGNFLLEEDLLPCLFVARDRFLKPGGKLIPGKGRMWLCPVFMPDYYARRIDVWSESRLIDHSLMRQFAVNRLYFGDFAEDKHDVLAPPVMLTEIDFYTASTAECRTKQTFVLEQSTVLHGFLGWFDIDFGHAWLSTSPVEKKTHWSQVFLPLENPQPVTAGDQVTVNVDRPQFGEWSWRVQMADGTRFSQSTFRGEPITPQRLKQASGTYRPQLNHHGEVLAFVLDAMDGSHSHEDIAVQLFTRYADEFPDVEAAKRFVAEQTRHFSD